MFIVQQIILSLPGIETIRKAQLGGFIFCFLLPKSIRVGHLLEAKVLVSAENFRAKSLFDSDFKHCCYRNFEYNTLFLIAILQMAFKKLILNEIFFCIIKDSTFVLLLTKWNLFLKAVSFKKKKKQKKMKKLEIFVNYSFLFYI